MLTVIQNNYLKEFRSHAKYAMNILFQRFGLEQVPPEKISFSIEKFKRTLCDYTETSFLLNICAEILSKCNLHTWKIKL